MSNERHLGNKTQAELKKETGKGVLRASSISTYARCPFSFFTKFLHNLPKAIERRKQDIPTVEEAQITRIRYSAAASLGTAVHTGMETAIRAKIKGEEPNINTVTIAALKEFETLSTEQDLWFNIDKGESKEVMLKQIPDLTKAYVEDILPYIDNPTATEEVYLVNINNPLLLSIQGSIDVEQENSVRDLKVTGAKAQIKRHLAQLSVYAWIREQNSKSTDRVYIDNIAKNSKKITTAILEDKPKTLYIENVLEHIQYVTEQWYESGCIGAGSDLIDLLTNEKRKDELNYLKLLFGGSNPSDDFLCNSKWCDSYASCPFIKGWENKKIIGEAIEI